MDKLLTNTARRGNAESPKAVDRNLCLAYMSPRNIKKRTLGPLGAEATAMIILQGFSQLLLVSGRAFTAHSRHEPLLYLLHKECSLDSCYLG